MQSLYMLNMYKGLFIVVINVIISFVVISVIIHVYCSYTMSCKMLSHYYSHIVIVYYVTFCFLVELKTLRFLNCYSTGEVPLYAKSLRSYGLHSCIQYSIYCVEVYGRPVWRMVSAN